MWSASPRRKAPPWRPVCWPQSLSHPQPESVLYDTSSTLGMTDRDIVLRCVAPEADPKSVPVKEIMSRRLAAVAPGDDVRQAARLMARRQIRRLPVVAEGKVVGMGSLGDLAQCGRYEMEISRALTDISSVVQKLSE